MTTVLKYVKQQKKVIAALAIAAVVAIPVGVRALTSQQADVATSEETTVEPETPQKVSPTVTTVNPDVILDENGDVVVANTVEQTEQTTPEEDAATTITAEQAQAIAQEEHPDSAIVKTKTKTLNDEVVYVIVFEDGWKVYVRASDGTVVKVQDAKDKEHSCKNAHKQRDAKQQTRKNTTKNTTKQHQNHKQTTAQQNRNHQRS